jgi:hypothetical protein
MRDISAGRRVQGRLPIVGCVLGTAAGDLERITSVRANDIVEIELVGGAMVGFVRLLRSLGRDEDQPHARVGTGDGDDAPGRERRHADFMTRAIRSC